MSIRVTDLPEHDRPRERLWRKGAAALSDTELIALVLRQGRAGESALELAAGLLAEYGGLDRLSTARAEELAARAGVGQAKAAALLAAFQLGRNLGSSPIPPTVSRPDDLATFALRELAGLRRERVLVLVLDAGNRVQRVVPLTDGSVDRSLLPVREVLNAVLRNDGVAFALAHNHPSGDPTPSRQDRLATEAVAIAARLVDLRFLDHLIVTDLGWTTVGIPDPPE
ncbi:MAG TPA: DNA repair protein RadC [Actinomycetes bacterium]|jgi:DNA repair protein RadC|nr:DNA repair protein RadC [Actinomycetes bacterium]